MILLFVRVVVLLIPLSLHLMRMLLLRYIAVATFVAAGCVAVVVLYMLLSLPLFAVIVLPLLLFLLLYALLFL